MIDSLVLGKLKLLRVWAFISLVVFECPFEVLTAVTVKSTTHFWDVMLCSLGVFQSAIIDYVHVIICVEMLPVS